MSRQQKEILINWLIRLSIGVVGFLGIRLVGQIDAMSDKIEQIQIDVAVIKAQMKSYERVADYKP